MNTNVTTEEELLRDVEMLRTRFSSTQELYREVCALLFFRYGITPTANKLYQLVRKGSMSAPAQALAKFWEELRSKSRTRIEHPDLPEELGTIAGGLLAELWTRSQALAQDALVAYRREADDAVTQAKAEVLTLQSEREAQERTITNLQEALVRANQLIAQQREEIEAANLERSSLIEMLDGAKRDNREFQQQLESARTEFSSELEKLRVVAKLSEERAWATEKRLLVDLDRERQTAARLQKKLEVLHTESLQTAEQHQQELTAVQLRLSDSQQEVAMLNGTLSAVTANLERTESELKDLQTHTAKTDSLIEIQEAARKSRLRRPSKTSKKKSLFMLRQRLESN